MLKLFEDLQLQICELKNSHLTQASQLIDSLSLNEENRKLNSMIGSRNLGEKV